MLKDENIPQTAVWIDGSFTTLTEKPNDIDLVIFVVKSYLESQFRSLDKISRSFPRLDIKWVPMYGRSDSLLTAIDQLEELKWQTLFSLGRNGKSKGFLRLNNERDGTL